VCARLHLAENSEISTQRPDLVRGLGLWSATAIVIGDTIGTGVFLVTSDMARAVGSATLVFVAWIAGGFIVLCGAFYWARHFLKPAALTSTSAAASVRSGDIFLAG
jgi:L-asparagine transporter-like permease